MERAGIKDILSGLIFVAFGLAFGYAASTYELGSAFRMGPGYFPLVLAAALTALGAAVVVKGWTAAAADSPIGVTPWKGMVLVLGALVFFGATIRGLGLVPAIFGAGLLSALASRHNGLAAALAIAACLTAACVAIFHFGLGVSVPLVGSWVR
ncbi:tripartite tricarboxylate transporter TctB family protein [Amaricoccus sp.]|uniref:tripartite tricarboxylate transporter TctB family protein n=1 Tax=Amaricoccus sp. TaxID=1872485 RepID=UPI001B483700|nr:tripartite tricarboxylate transporter TctB family protein [Amaricoccus sp.]MBP7002362.1 tripartite tricarboxylate transporter TctB family protein [Amaricoccus sp.]